jgi:hypothetical protein
MDSQIRFCPLAFIPQDARIIWLAAFIQIFSLWFLSFQGQSEFQTSKTTRFAKRMMLRASSVSGL